MTEDVIYDTWMCIFLQLEQRDLRERGRAYCTCHLQYVIALAGFIEIEIGIL